VLAKKLTIGRFVFMGGVTTSLETFAAANKLIIENELLVPAEP